MKKLITPGVWGEDTWRVMHVVALGYPAAPTEADRETYRAFFEGLRGVLPCANCRDGFAKVMRDHPIRLEGTDALFRWTVDAHNAVNRKLGHDVMDPDWVKTVYIFRDHERAASRPLAASPARASPLATVAVATAAAVALAFLVITFLRRRGCAGAGEGAREVSFIVTAPGAAPYSRLGSTSFSSG